MRKTGLAGLLVILCFFLVGMGGLGGTGSINVPEPGTNYSATIIDLSDFATRVEKFSFEGKTFLAGKMGDADITIGFDRITSIAFVLHEDRLTAEVRLRDGETIPLSMNKKVACYGEFAYGGYRIAVEHIKSITVHGEVLPQEKQPS
jgi:hypothetical protein